MSDLRLLATTLADIALASAVGAEGAPAVKDALNHLVLWTRGLRVSS